MRHGDEPAIKDLGRIEEKKTAEGERDAYDNDTPTFGAWELEEAADSSVTAGPFRAATSEALEQLREHENSVEKIPDGIIPVVIADPQTYGPDANITFHRGWYNKKTGKWLKEPGTVVKAWTPKPEPGIGSRAALAVFRNSSGAPIRSSYTDFKAKNQGAAVVSLDALEGLIPRAQQTPLTDRAKLKRLLEACSYGQLASGDYVVGVEEAYAVFRLSGAQSGQPRRVIPTAGGEALHELPDGDYVAYCYTVPIDSAKDQAQRHAASVDNLILTIGDPDGDPVPIWPKDPVRRQRLIDDRKPERLGRVLATGGEWRDNWQAFCAHYRLADASLADIVVFPMVAVAATANLPWHITVPKDDLGSYLDKIPRPGEGADPPPSIKNIWDNVPKAHATIEWYRGAWDNPVNPRIFRDVGVWSFIAKVGTDAGGGRQTIDPFTGEPGPTTVTIDLKEQYNRFTKRNPAAEVIKQILTANLAP